MLQTGVLSTVPAAQERHPAALRAHVTRHVSTEYAVLTSKGEQSGTHWKFFCPIKLGFGFTLSWEHLKLLFEALHLLLYIHPCRDKCEVKI